MEKEKNPVRRLMPLAAAMLLAALIPLETAALFGARKETAAPAPGAPIAQNMEIRVYRGVACSGVLRASDNEGGDVTFRVVTPPSKGTLEIGEEGVFVYTPDPDKSGSDGFAFVAIDESGNVSAPATVKIRIERAASGVAYADTDASCATAAVDLAEHGVFVGARVGDDWFFEPERTVSRGEFIAMAMAAAGIGPSDVTVTGFADDDAIPTWAKGSAAGALAAGVVYGVKTEQGVAYRAERAVTVSEAAAVLDRILRLTDVDLAALDGETPAWYAQAAANLESVRIAPAGGFGGGMDRAVTRGEAAQLLSAAMALTEARAEKNGIFGRIF